MTDLSANESSQVIKYTLVALAGILAGVILGCVISRSTVSGPEAIATPVLHPRAIEARP